MNSLNKNLWSKLNDQLVNHTISYLTIFEKLMINKHYYKCSHAYATKKKNYIWHWYKYHSLRLEMNYEVLDNINSIRSYYKLKTPVSIKIHLIFELYDPSVLNNDYSCKNVNMWFNRTICRLSINDLLNLYPI